ncbi:MAG: T9SS type A sorting domain-containing protein [Aquaticitalea sp.]
MRYLYTLLMFIAVHTAFAQTDLYVSNNAATYIYVDGTIFNDTPVSATVNSANAPLFVTNNIELQDANSYIYLRNDGQLLQSASSTGNSGLGNLSVYQEGNVSAFEYNYWCSPIGSKTASMVSNPFGVALLNDVVSVTASTPATLLPLAVREGTATPLAISARWIYKYTASNLYSDWIPVFNATTINPGEGFTMKGTVVTTATPNNPTGTNQRYDFRGKPNTGTFAIPVAAPVAGVAQQTLVGNPYPSALDARAYLHDTQNLAAITTALYYWEQTPNGTHFTSGYEGGYGSYTINAAGGAESYTPATFLSYDAGGNSTGPGGGTSTRTARRYIPVGQGFMVEGRINGVARAKNNMRAFYKETSANSEFFRNVDSDTESTVAIEYNEYGFSIVPTDYKRFRVNVEFNNLYKRQLLQNFHASATEFYDVGLEAKSPEGPSSDAYWPLDNDAYVIQAHDFDIDLKIPMVIRLNESQPISFSLFDIQNFDASQPIFIHDKETGVYVNLRNQNYDLNLPVGNYSNRFEISFTEETLSTPEVTAADFKIFQENPKAQLTILNPNGIDIKSVRMFDTAGKQIFDAPNLSLESAYHFSTKTLSEGVYVATITLGTNEVISKKVVVKN